jgi:LmbE family N-acetylglucosaminyl deacetylase
MIGSPQGPELLDHLAWPRGLRVLVLAPHPDDFDAIAVTLRFFRDRDCGIRLVVASSSASGVEDSYCTPPATEVKAALREDEQRESCRLFGLPEHCISFLRMTEDEKGHPLDDAGNFDRMRAALDAARPDIVFLPHGNDTNAGHRRNFAMLERFAQQADYPVTALLNRDPKTVEMRHDLLTFFGAEAAEWKARLLRCHRSQQQRNLNTRGYGFDERILRLNREVASAYPNHPPYAEAFEIFRRSESQGL